MFKDLEKFINKHQIIGLDSMIYIYHFEEKVGFCEKTKEIFLALEDGQFQGVSSVISLIEILTKPKKKRNFYLVKEYERLITNFPNLKIQDVDLKIADLASSLRAEYNLTTPDAIVIATAIISRATGLITLDIELARVKEIEVFVLL